MVLRLLISGLLAVSVAAPVSYAHVMENMGFEEFPSALPDVRNLPPIADQETQQMAINMRDAECEKLNAMSKEVKEAFLIAQLNLQREGALSKIVGPKCTFLGEAQKIAEISDPSLTITSDKEVLYYLSDMHVILVSHQQRDTIAYGMFYHGETPVDYFLEERNSAQRSADVARLFAETVGSLQLTPGVPGSTQAPQPVSSSSTATSVNVFSESSEAPVLPTQPVPTPLPTSSAPSFFEGSSEQQSSVLVAAEASSSAGITTSEGVPTIEPIGPEPPPPEAQRSYTLWIALGVFVLIATVIVVLYLKRKKEAQDSPTA